MEWKIAYVAKFGVPFYPQRERHYSRLWFYGSLDPVLYYQPYWVSGFKGYLVHTAHIPPAVEWKIAYMAKFAVPSFPQSWASLCQIFMYQPYWVRGFKGYLVHITHIPDLLWNQNRVYGLVRDAVVTTNDGVPVDYGCMAVWTLYCMYQPYWVCGSKGYLVHKAHLHPALELKVAYMAKFGVPSLPQSMASLWQIMIWWQFGPCTVCTSHIGSVGPRSIWCI